MRTVDWAATPIGHMESWPQSLRTAVSICLASHFPMMIWWGAELVMIYNDACRPILGQTRHHRAMGQPGRLVWPEILGVIGPMLERVLERGEATQSDNILLPLDRNGYIEEGYYTFSCSPILDDSDSVGGVFTAVTETTEQVLGKRRLEALEEAQSNELALREVNHRMEEFLHLVGHELRSPLTSLKGMTQLGQRRLARLMADDRVASLPEVAARLAAIEETLIAADTQIGRMNRLIADLVDAARADSGHLNMRVTRCNLSVIVQEVVAAQCRSQPQRVIALSQPEHPVMVQVDGDRIRQVLSNYVTNALKYSAQDQPVEVWVEQTGRIARVSVRDQGPGLEPDQRCRVWERHARIAGIRVQDEAVNAGGGLGLGLYISRQIVELHGGGVGVESVPGHGSTFFFTLPSMDDRS